jgi:hypothetical protein
MEGINQDDLETLSNYRLFLKGNTNTPQRFWIWKLFCKERFVDEEALKLSDYIELDIVAEAKKKKGISLTILSN